MYQHLLVKTTIKYECFSKTCTSLCCVISKNKLFKEEKTSLFEWLASSSDFNLIDSF